MLLGILFKFWDCFGEASGALGDEYKMLNITEKQCIYVLGSEL